VAAARPSVRAGARRAGRAERSCRPYLLQD